MISYKAYKVSDIQHLNNSAFMFNSVVTLSVKVVRQRHSGNPKAGWEVRQWLPNKNRPTGDRCVVETTDFKDKKFTLPAWLEIA